MCNLNDTKATTLLESPGKFHFHLNSNSCFVARFVCFIFVSIEICKLHLFKARPL